MNKALEDLKRVLCDNDGKICVVFADDPRGTVIQQALADLEKLLAIPKEAAALVDRAEAMYKTLRQVEHPTTEVERLFFKMANTIKQVLVQNNILTSQLNVIAELSSDSDSGKLFKTFSMGQNVRSQGDVKSSASYRHGEICDCTESDSHPEVYSVRWNNGQIEHGFLPDDLVKND